jgi:cytochrome c-type biogenesis protein CcmH
MRWVGLKQLAIVLRRPAPSPLWGRPGGGSRRLSRQETGGAFDHLVGPRDPPPLPAPTSGGGCANAIYPARTQRAPGSVSWTRSWIQQASVLGVLLASLASPARAVQPDEVMKDPALETRARALSSELRCLVCQNESIDDSEAPLARDIRVLIRERIGKGESNDAVRAYLVSRYGDFILLKPPFKPETLLLWLSPVLVLGLGVASAFYARRRAPSVTPGLSEEEEARLLSLTSGDANNG